MRYHVISCDMMVRGIVNACLLSIACRTILLYTLCYQNLYCLLPSVLQDSVLMEHGAACLAAMSLRSPTNSAKIVECGAIEVLVRCMRSHSDKSSMQRQGQCNPHYITSPYPHPCILPFSYLRVEAQDQPALSES